MAMALATPTMLPVPTRLAVDTIRAWKADTEFAPLGFSPTTRMDSGSSRSWTSFPRKVKYRPTPSSMMIRMQLYM